jgi:hypothetical protein
MKQYIDRNQWEELTDDQQVYLMNICNCTPTVTIGQLIEFLGEDLIMTNENNEWFVEWNCEFINGENVNNENSLKWELIDALWEATKYKLNETKTP